MDAFQQLLGWFTHQVQPQPQTVAISQAPTLALESAHPLKHWPVETINWSAQSVEPQGKPASLAVAITSSSVGKKNKKDSIYGSNIFFLFTYIQPVRLNSTSESWKI